MTHSKSNLAWKVCHRMKGLASILNDLASLPGYFPFYYTGTVLAETLLVDCFVATLFAKATFHVHHGHLPPFVLQVETGGSYGLRLFAFLE